MKAIKGRNILSSNKGMATLEALPLLVIFLVFISYGMGLFGFIHTGILYSISARTYLFEAVRNRTNATYFRENLSGLTDPIHFKNIGMRYQIIQSESVAALKGEITATSRPIAVGRPLERGTASELDHNTKIFELQSRNKTVGVNPAWVMVGYGLCINAGCGDRPPAAP